MQEPTLSMFAQQWRLSRIQLVNWGTFCGYHDFPLECGEVDGAPAVVMITGDSGTGKSTIFDAKTAVLQKHNVPFNVASNTLQRGRARGGNQRSLYTYVLGKQDDVYDDATGEEREMRLRPTTTPQWSAIVLTFEDSQGALFVAARFYYVPAQGQESDLKQYLLTSEAEVDPRNLESRLTQSIGKKLLSEVYPQATVHDTVSAFLTCVYGHMDIGPDADGDNAMRLHQRIQGGYPITDVDALFKELVIDDPSTYAYAQRALDSFAESENVWEQMDEVRQKLSMLSGIRESYANYEENRERLELLDSILTDDAAPLALWTSRRQGQVLSHAIEQVQEQQGGLSARLAGLTSELEEARRERDTLAREVQTKGGDAIDRRREQLAAARAAHEVRKRERANMRRVLEAAHRDLPRDSREFEALQAGSQAFIDGYDAQDQDLSDHRIQIQMRSRDLRERGGDIEEQLAYYRAHPVNITPEMARERDAMAKALGVSPADLPYAAELMDLAPEEERWRLAACIGYHALATQVLVDDDHLDELSVAIDDLKLRRRVSFRGIDLRRTWSSRPREGWLSSKMVVREDSPFASWLRHELCNPDRDHECVETPQELAGEGPRIDLAGQTRTGRRGAHGYNERTTLIIGFANKALVDRLEAEQADIIRELAEAQRLDHDLNDQRRLLAVRRDAANWMLQHSYEQVDVASVAAQIEGYEAEIARLEADDTLKTLIARRDALEAEVSRLDRTFGAVQKDVDQCEEAKHEFEALREKSNRKLAQLRDGGVAVTEAQDARISQAAARNESALLGVSGDNWQALARSFDMVSQNTREELQVARSRAQGQQTTAGNNLSEKFRSYHDRWLGEDDPTGVKVESYPDYLRMLEELEADRLNEPRDQWLKSLFVQTATTLVPLAHAFLEDLHVIHNRMRPINQIMERFDFGPEHGRLRIAVRDRERAEVARFRQGLERWASLATRVDSVELTEATHRELRLFMERLGDELSRKTRGVLNTKNLVNITVVAHYPQEAGKPDNTYASLDAKSGGETQELIAFILGAALLFCLGRNAQGLPSFSPVFLDEAFVKADEHFTRRAIHALSGLGFQVIIAVPTSKVQAVEPVASQYVCITKNRSGQSFISPMVRKRGDQGA